MTSTTLLAHISVALELLPEKMRGPSAKAMLLAIALQESGLRHRRQFDGGPARGFWMFEPNGVAGVLHHHQVQLTILEAAAALQYPEVRSMPPETVCQVLQHNDVLAACFARCLLWTLPEHLPPTIFESEAAWGQYVEAWRPGKPRHAAWRENYTAGWALQTSVA